MAEVVEFYSFGLHRPRDQFSFPPWQSAYCIVHVIIGCTCTLLTHMWWSHAVDAWPQCDLCQSPGGNAVNGELGTMTSSTLTT